MSVGSEVQYYLRVARRRAAYFAIPLAVVAAIGVGIVMSLPAIYNSSATILVESQQIPEQFVRSTVTALASERLEVIKQRVMTRENLLAIADKFKLFSDRKELTKTDLVDLMRSRITFQMMNVGTTSRKKQNDNLAVAFALGFDYERARDAAGVANELVTLVLNEDIQNRTGRATETTRFLAQESERLATQLKELDGVIAQFKLDNSDTLPEKLSFNMSLLEKRQKEIDDINQNLSAGDTQIRMLELESRVRAAQQVPTKGDKPGQTLEQKLEALKSAYAERSAIYADAHPEMRALRKQIAVTQDAVDKAKVTVSQAKPLDPDNPNLTVEQRLLAEKIGAIQRTVEMLKKRKTAAEETMEKLQKTIEQTPAIGAQLASYERQREALQKSSDDMAVKLGQARLGERLEENQQAERFEVIEAPLVPQDPVRPKRIPLLGLALGAALAVGASTALAAEFLDATVKRSSDLTNKLNKRLLVTIPFVRTTRDVRRYRVLAIVIMVLILLLIGGGLVALHFLYTPLDILFFRVWQAIQRTF